MWTSNINQAKEKGGLENVDVWETATVGIATATGTTATIATGGAMTAVAPAAVSTLGGMVTIGATSSLAGGIATRASYNCAYNLNSPMSNQLDYVLDPKAQAYDMVVGGLSGGVAYGISNYSPKKVLPSANRYQKASIFERTFKKSAKVTELYPNSYDDFSKVGLSDNAVSEYIDEIRYTGKISTPIKVQKLSAGGYEIVDGHHKWYVASRSGLKRVPIIIKNYKN